jgi:repressor of nif and glnA expression
MDDQISMTNLEILILRILEAHPGAGERIPRKILVEEINANCPFTPYGERRIRYTIKHLREQHGERIGSCGGGYFEAITADEVRAISKYHRGRALSELVSAAKIERSSLAALLGQLSMEFSQSP